eukprot:1821653-Pleurochrysis_carterae.AAC.1
MPGFKAVEWHHSPMKGSAHRQYCRGGARRLASLLRTACSVPRIIAVAFHEVACGDDHDDFDNSHSQINFN